MKRLSTNGTEYVGLGKRTSSYTRFDTIGNPINEID